MDVLTNLLEAKSNANFMGHRWRKELRSKDKFSNFVPISRLNNFVGQRQKTEKKVASGKQTILLTKQTEKSLGPVGLAFIINF